MSDTSSSRACSPGGPDLVAFFTISHVDMARLNITTNVSVSIAVISAISAASDLAAAYVLETQHRSHPLLRFRVSIGNTNLDTRGAGVRKKEENRLQRKKEEHKSECQEHWV